MLDPAAHSGRPDDTVAIDWYHPRATVGCSPTARRPRRRALDAAHRSTSRPVDHLGDEIPHTTPRRWAGCPTAPGSPTALRGRSRLRPSRLLAPHRHRLAARRRALRRPARPDGVARRQSCRRRPLGAAARRARVEPRRRPPDRLAARERRTVIRRRGRSVVVRAWTGATGSSATPPSTPTVAGSSRPRCRRSARTTGARSRRRERLGDRGAVATSGSLVVLRSTGSSSVTSLNRHDHDGTGSPVDRSGLPVALAGLSARRDADEACSRSPASPVPPTLFRWSARRSRDWSDLPGGPDADGFAVEQVTYPSTDGTEIPMFLIGADRCPAERRAHDPHRLRRVRDHDGPRLQPARSWPSREEGGRCAVANHPRRVGGGRGVAPRRHARAQAAGVRRLPRRGRLARRRRPHEPRGWRSGGGERRPAHGRGHHPAARPVPRRRVRGAAARHGALPPLPHRQALDPRVRRPRRRRRVRVAVRVLAVPPRRRRHLLPGDAHRDGRGGLARRSRARPQVRRPPAGHDVRRRRHPCSCASRPRPATVRASRSPARPTSWPTCWPSSSGSSVATRRGRTRRGERVQMLDDQRVGSPSQPKPQVLVAAPAADERAGQLEVARPQPSARGRRRRAATRRWCRSRDRGQAAVCLTAAERVEHPFTAQPTTGMSRAPSTEAPARLAHGSTGRRTAACPSRRRSRRAPRRTRACLGQPAQTSASDRSARSATWRASTGPSTRPRAGRRGCQRARPRHVGVHVLDRPFGTGPARRSRIALVEAIRLLSTRSRPWRYTSDEVHVAKPKPSLIEDEEHAGLACLLAVHGCATPEHFAAQTNPSGRRSR